VIVVIYCWIQVMIAEDACLTKVSDIYSRCWPRNHRVTCRLFIISLWNAYSD